MKNITEMTIEELSAMKSALVQYFDSTRDEYWRRFDGAGDADERGKILEEKDAELSMINALIRNINEAETEWKKTHTINFRDRLRQSKSI